MLGELTQIQAGMAGCAQLPTWPLADEDLVACLEVLQSIAAGVATVRSHLIGELDTRGVPSALGASSTGAFLSDRLRIDGRQAKRWVELASVLTQRPALDLALGCGAVSAEQVHVIGACVAALPTAPNLPTTTELEPTWVSEETITAAETTLIAQAATFEPRTLRRLGDRILFHVAPQIAERITAQRLLRQETRAYDSRELRLSPLGDGRVRLSGWFDTEGAAIITAALDPLCNPLRPTPAKHRDPTGTEPEAAESTHCNTGTPTLAEPTLRRSPAQRRADALIELCRAASLHPNHHGGGTNLNVTVAFDPLTQQLRTATLDTGEHLSPTTTRRLACDATILPAILSSHAQVLDVGRTRRLFTGALRTALNLRDRGCTFPSCDRPTAYTDAHHITSWLNGGPTALHNAVLLCRHHHRHIHHSEWKVQLGPDGHPQFYPPTWIDPKQQPRRNNYHRRL
jgi:hypothetical protein